MGATISSILSVSGDYMSLNPTTTASATLHKPAEAGTETPRLAQEDQGSNTPQDPYAGVVFIERMKFHDDEEEMLRPRKLRKLRAGMLFSSAVGGTACPEEDGQGDEGQGGEDKDEQEVSTSDTFSSPLVGLITPSYPFRFTFSVPRAEVEVELPEQGWQVDGPGELSFGDRADSHSSDEGIFHSFGSFSTVSHVAELDERVYGPGSGAPSLYDELASLDELTLESDDETSTDDEDEGTYVFSAGDGRVYTALQHVGHRDSLDLHRERIRAVQGEAVVNWHLGSEEEYEDEEEWFDAEDGLLGEEGSGDDIPSENIADSPSPCSSATSCSTTSLGIQPFPPWAPSTHTQYLDLTGAFAPLNSTTPSQGVRHVTFFETPTRFGGDLGKVSPIAHNPLTPLHLLTNTGRPDVPSITLTPPTPHSTLFLEARLRERWPGYPYPPRIDRDRLFVRHSDFDLRGSSQRNKRAVHDRWEIVKRRRGRLQDALREKYGAGLEAWRLAQQETRGWTEWAWSGNEP